MRAAPAADPAQVDGAARDLVGPFSAAGGESPYAIQADLQEMMQEYVGIYRDEDGMRPALGQIDAWTARARGVRAEGPREYNPGWHAAQDLYSMLTVAMVVTRAALERRETRGGHSRTDYPKTDAEWGKVNVVVRKIHGQLTLDRVPIPEMPATLKALLEVK